MRIDGKKCRTVTIFVSTSYRVLSKADQRSSLARRVHLILRTEEWGGVHAAFWKRDGKQHEVNHHTRSTSAGSGSRPLRGGGCGSDLFDTGRCRQPADRRPGVSNG